MKYIKLFESFVNEEVDIRGLFKNLVSTAKQLADAGQTLEDLTSVIDAEIYNVVKRDPQQPSKKLMNAPTPVAEGFVTEMTTGYAQDKAEKARKASTKAKDTLDNVKKAQQSTDFANYINPAIEKSVKAAGLSILKLSGRKMEIMNYGHTTSFLPNGKQRTGDEAKFCIEIDREGYKFTTGFPGMLDSGGLTKLKSIITTIQNDLKGK